MKVKKQHVTQTVSISIVPYEHDRILLAGKILVAKDLRPEAITLERYRDCESRLVIKYSSDMERVTSIFASAEASVVFESGVIISSPMLME